MVNLLALLILAGVGAFMIWFGRLFLSGASSVQQFEQKIMTEGVETDAEIVNNRVSTGSRGASYYFITYQYTAKMPDGQPQKLTSEDAVSHADYERLTLGSHITVRYLPGDPKSVRPGDGIRETFSSNTLRWSGWILAVLGIGLVIFGFVLFGVFTVKDNQTAAASTATTIRESATPNMAEIAATKQSATATMQYNQTTAAAVRDKVQPRLAGWKKVTDKVMHRVLPPETDLGLREVEIDYGYCANGAFYMYAWTRITDRLNLGYEIDTFLEGFGYVEGSTPPDCYPKELAQVWLRDAGTLGDNWYAINGATEVKIQK